MKVAESIGIEQLMQNLPVHYTPVDRDNVLRAYEVAAEAHRHQQRASGDPYVTHCVAVANILAEMRMPADVIQAGLLHDTVEDTDIKLKDIENMFTKTVADLVYGVTKLDTLPRVSRSDSRANEPEIEPEALTPEQLSRRKKQLADETLRKTILAMNDDIRVVIIKLADRLHNMRTLGFTKPEKQKRVGQETLDIYAQIASRLGIWRIKWELEDLAFRYVHPDKYKEIAAQLNDRRIVREEQVQQIIETVKDVMKQSGIEAEVSGRPKHLYSIWHKMQKKGKNFLDVRDVRGIRLIVKDIPTCYAALGIVHNRWRPLPGEFDDYIAAPKENMYQSLHTAVNFEDGQPLEVQIRTLEMHQNAEYGIAAHWRYKDGSKRDLRYEQQINWLRSLVDIKNDAATATEFVESMKNDVFVDRVYAFTPKGDIIDLPGGSTPIDFAYHVHTDIGHRCRGAKINDKLVTLDTVLKTGDRVSILTAKQGGPSRDWLNPSLGLVKTQRALAKIRIWFKRQDHEQNLTQGRQMLEREFHRIGVSEINLENLARQLEYRNPDEMFVNLGCGDLSITQIIAQIADQNPPEEDTIETSRPKSEIESSSAVTVRGLRGMLTQMARCCNPTPGDPIIGYITRGRGATIHREDCPNILKISTTEKERLTKVSWSDSIKTYAVPILVEAIDRHGLMGEISNLLSNEGVNITNFNVRISQGNMRADTAYIRLVVEVLDLKQLSKVLSRIANLQNVVNVERVRAG